MVVVEVNGKTFYMDGYLKSNLDYVKYQVKNYINMCTILIDGRIGSGKSTLASQIAYYCSDGRFNIDQETFTGKQFYEQLNSIYRGGAIVLDEAFLILNKRKTLSSSNMLSLALMQQARHKQCFIIICLPSVYDLDKNLILNIADFYIRTYRKDFGNRGRYACYDRQGLKDLWLYCRQSYSYFSKVAQPNFRGRFTKNFPLDMAAYEKKKLESLESLKEEKKEGNPYLKQRNTMIKNLRTKGQTVNQIMEICNLSSKQVYNILNEKIEETKVVEIEAEA